MSAVVEPPVATDAEPRERPRAPRRRGLAPAFAFSNVSAIYIWIAVIALFAWWIPDLFLTTTTAASILNENAITGLVALSLLVPLAAGVFDLSVGYTLGVASVTVAWMVGNGSSPVVAALAALAIAFVIGLVNATVVVVFKVDSFIGTLATGSLLQAAILVISGNRQMIAGVNTLSPFSSQAVGPLRWPVLAMFVVALALWYVMQHTATGRRVYATGQGREAARLAGIRTERIRFVSLLVSATTCGLAGVLVTALVGAGSPTVGPAYLIPAFAAAFLGATQFRGGGFNARGTVVAVLLLGTVATGLALAGVPMWVPYVFTGSVLIGALALGGLKRRRSVEAV
ncbi:ABC transporter permease [Nitriliruptoraceae bacterium ZYF776]|nr:ABC transporter permease [Profundirhabdus halotolerans]